MADYITPFIQGFGLAQTARRTRLAEQEAKQRAAEVQQLREQQAIQNATQAALGFLREDNPEAAQQIYDTVLAPKLGPAKIVGKKGNQYHMVLGDGRVVGIDPATNTATPVRFAAPDLSQTQFEVGQEGAGVPMAPSPAQREFSQAGEPIIAPIRGQGSQGSLTDQAIRMLATDPATGQLDPNKVLQLRSDAMTNPQGFEGRTFDALVQDEKQNPSSKEGSPELRAYQRMRGIVGELAGTRAAAGEAGRLGVQSTPQYQQTQTDITAAREAGRPLPTPVQTAIAQIENVQQQIGVIKQNSDPNFLGPIKGTDTAFEVRRRLGSYIGSPLEEKEVQFRQSLGNIADTLLRLRSGAQINEKEFSRLRGLLPKATDEPKVFDAGLKRFETELSSILESKRSLATTPRGQARGAPTGRPLPPDVARQILQEAGGDKNKAREIARERGYTF